MGHPQLMKPRRVRSIQDIHDIGTQRRHLFGRPAQLMREQAHAQPFDRLEGRVEQCETMEAGELILLRPLLQSPVL